MMYCVQIVPCQPGTEASAANDNVVRDDVAPRFWVVFMMVCAAVAVISFVAGFL